MSNISKRIEERIINLSKGSVFVASDFVDICSKQTANRVLLRLVDKNIVHKVIRGIYYSLNYNDLIKEYVMPSPIDVANAIARNYGWTIIPFGDTALNALGLSNQIPSVYSYVSDGIYKEYSFNNTKIIFKKTANKNISNYSYKTSLVIQALKALGKERVNSNILIRINSILTNQEKELMLKEAKITTSWIYELIKQICKK